MNLEKEFIQRLINDPSNLAKTSIKPDDLRTQAYRDAFVKLKEQIKTGIEVDLMTIFSALPEHQATLSDLNGVDKSNFQYFDGLLKKEIQTRELQILYDTARISLEKGEDPGKVSALVQTKTINLMSEEEDDKLKSTYDLSLEFGPILEKRYSAGGKLPGIKTGIPRLDLTFGGFQPGTYYIGARPSQGKTALMLTMARAAMKEKKVVGIISVESSQIDLISRLWSADANIKLNSLKSGTGLKPSEFAKIKTAIDFYKDSPAYIYFNTKADVDEVENIARHMVKSLGVDIIFIDYLQRIYSHGNTKFEQVSNASRAMTDIAKGFQVPVVCLAQTGRQADKESPALNHFQHSSAIEQDADVAIIIVPPDESVPDDLNHWGLYVLKNRDGTIGRTPVYFDKEHVRFEPWNGPTAWSNE